MLATRPKKLMGFLLCLKTALHCWGAKSPVRPAVVFHRVF